MALIIDNCHVCRQRAELMLYAPDGRMVCGECRLVMDAGAVKNLGENNSGPQLQPIQYAQAGPQVRTEEDLERETYIRIIQDNADDAWVAKLIKEVISKKILKYDWARVIANPRWFSVLDLRRFALDLDPNMDKRVVEEPDDEDPPAVVPDEEQPAEATA